MLFYSGETTKTIAEWKRSGWITKTAVHPRMGVANNHAINMCLADDEKTGRHDARPTVVGIELTDDDLVGARRFMLGCIEPTRPIPADRLRDVGDDGRAQRGLDRLRGFDGETTRVERFERDRQRLAELNAELSAARQAGLDRRSVKAKIRD